MVYRDALKKLLFYAFRDVWWEKFTQPANALIKQRYDMLNLFCHSF